MLLCLSGVALRCNECFSIDSKRVFSLNVKFITSILKTCLIQDVMHLYNTSLKLTIEELRNYE